MIMILKISLASSVPKKVYVTQTRLATRSLREREQSGQKVSGRLALFSEQDTLLTSPTETESIMNKTEMYIQQLRQLRSNFYAKDKPTIQEMMEFAQEEAYLVKKMNGKF